MNYLEKTITYAPEAFRHLRGYMCVFKPANKGANWLRNTLKMHLCEGLNALEQRPVKDEVEIVGTLTKNNLQVVTHPSYSDNILVVGPRYQLNDIKLKLASPLLWAGSGVTLVSVFPNLNEEAMLRSSNMIRTYHMDCQLGFTTNSGWIDGRVIDRRKFRHVNAALMERILGAIQFNFQNSAFMYAGVQPDSEEAYKLVSSGLIRPDRSGSPPLIYSLRCLDLQPPKFTLEIQVINESEKFLCHLIRDIGQKLRTAAALERFRLMRFGPFTAEMALLQRNWTLEQILMNIQQTNRKIDELRYSGLLGKPTPGESLLKVVND